MQLRADGAQSKPVILLQSQSSTFLKLAKAFRLAQWTIGVASRGAHGMAVPSTALPCDCDHIGNVEWGLTVGTVPMRGHRDAFHQCSYAWVVDLCIGEMREAKLALHESRCHEELHAELCRSPVSGRVWKRILVTLEGTRHATEATSWAWISCSPSM